MKKSTILTVEDNSVLQKYLKLLLSKKYKVITANHGQMALDLLKVNPQIELVLSDLRMPVMDGYQLLDTLKNDDKTRHIPFVMLTAQADTKDKMRVLRLGVDDYILKPFEDKELLVRVEILLKNSFKRGKYLKAEYPSRESKFISKEDQKWLEDFEHYVQSHFSDATLSIPKLAKLFMMSESSLLRKLKSLTGLTVVKYIQEARLNKARQLLEGKKVESVRQAIGHIGYANGRTFSRAFKKRYGKLPSEVLES